MRAARAAGVVAYAVPGSPTVAEATVRLLRSGFPDLEVSVVPGLSFADLAWQRTMAFFAKHVKG